jgi:hypothetical protein
MSSVLHKQQNRGYFTKCRFSSYNKIFSASLWLHIWARTLPKMCYLRFQLHSFLEWRTHVFAWSTLTNFITKPFLFLLSRSHDLFHPRDFYWTESFFRISTETHNLSQFWERFIQSTLWLGLHTLSFPSDFRLSVCLFIYFLQSVLRLSSCSFFVLITPQNTSSSSFCRSVRRNIKFSIIFIIRASRKLYYFYQINYEVIDGTCSMRE